MRYSCELSSYGRRQLHDRWAVDSGESWHMTSRRGGFYIYEPISSGSMFMGTLRDCWSWYCQTKNV